jgi:uncharacterized protein YqjF (DUF2071 family)
VKPDVRGILADVAHRTTPLPSGPWLMFQSWQDLMFVHWPVPAAVLRPLVPPPLTLEEFDGTAWVAVTPFVLRGLRVRRLPPFPDFPEMNFRTYVRFGDVPGIHFFSLDAANRLAVAGARTFYRLPYKSAVMRVSREGPAIQYQSRRPNGSARLAARYHPVGPTFQPGPGTLEHFLTERYALYVVLRSGSVLRGDIQHPPWDLRAAEADILVNTVPEAEGVGIPDGEPLLHFSARQDTLIWPPRVVG